MHQLWLSVAQKIFCSSCLLLSATVGTSRGQRLKWFLCSSHTFPYSPQWLGGWKCKAAKTECNSFRFILGCVYRSVWRTAVWSSTEMLPRVSQNSFISPAYLYCRSGTFLLRVEGGPHSLRSFWLFPAVQSDIWWESRLHGFYRVLHRSSLILDPTGRESKSSQFGPGTCLWGPAIIT